MSVAGRPRVWALALLLFLLHFLLHVGFSFGRGAPDLLTLGLLLVAREASMGRAAVVGLVFGLMEDALSVLAFGANTVAMTLLGIAGSATRDLFVGDSRLFLISYVFLGKWSRDLVHWVAVGQQLRQPFVEQVVVAGGVSAAYLAVIGILVAELVGVGRAEV